MGAALPGSAQPAQRAEVHAVLCALAMACSRVWLITDSRYVCDRLLEGGSRRATGQAHLDLWEQIDALAHKLGHVSWVKAHLTWEQASVAGFTALEWGGSQMADILARAGVDLHEDPPTVVAERVKKLELVSDI